MILKNITFFNGQFEKESADIKVENGVFSQIGFLQEDGRDCTGMLMLPGFIDIHIHGCGGGDFGDGSKAALDKMSAYLARNGITSFCPTAMTLPEAALTELLAIGKSYMGHETGAKIAGFHLEGPFIAMEKKGAQNPAYIKGGSIEEFNRLNEACGGNIRLITIAPEAFSSEEFIREVSKKCAVSIGHSCADAEECNAAFDWGANHVTHLFNAMTPMNHRDAGIVGTALDRNGVMCELICDGGHICPAVLRNAFRILGEDRGVVISDSMKGAGLGQGTFDLGGQTVYVEENGKYATLKDGTIAASVTNLYQEFKNLLSFGIDLKTALKACTINPAKSIGLENRIGSIVLGKAADFILTDPDFNMKEVYINGIHA